MSKVKKLAFDISLAPRPYNGIGVYARELLAALSRRPEWIEWDVSVICAVNQDESLYNLPEKTEVIRLPGSRQSRLGYLKTYQWQLPSLLSGAGMNVYHAPGNSIALQAPTPPIWSSHLVHRVLTIHDIIPVVFPSVYPSRKWKRKLQSSLFGFYIARMAQNAMIITSSSSSARDMITHLRISPDKIRVIPIGVNTTLLNARKDFELPQSLVNSSYLLHVGTGNLNKNIPGLLRVFLYVRNAMPDSDLKLVLVGDYSDHRPFMTYARNVEQDILVFSNINYDLMATLYRHAAALVFPSIYEGFGLPCLEAMSLGCPVVASNTSSIPEVVENGANLFDPQDERGMADQVIKILQDKVFANSLVERGLARAAKFNWDEIARQTLDVYEQAIKTPNQS